MDKHLSFSERLCSFLDNELDSAETSTLFHMLAHNEELQMEMRQQLILRSALQAPLLLPPDRLREGILSRIALQEFEAAGSGTITPMGGFIHHLITNRPFIVLISLVTGAVISLLLSGIPSSTVVPAKPGIIGAAAGSDHQRTRGVDASAVENPGVRSNHTTVATAVEPSRLQQGTRGRGSVAPGTDGGVGERREYRRPSSNAVDVVSTRIASRRSQERSGIEAAIPQSAERPAMHLISAAGVREIPLHLPAMVDTPALLSMDTLTGDMRGHDDSPFHHLSLELRGFMARSIPAVDIPPLSASIVNNGSVSLLYDLSEHHALGIEAGREDLEQEYDLQSVPDTKTLYEQNYMAGWAGASYRYTFGSFTETFAIRPFAHGIVGASRIGPVGRMVLGLRISDNPSMTLGAEGSLFLYRFGGRWFSTEKLGITYGLAVHF